MPKSLKPTVILVFALSIVFTAFFLAAKHVASLLRVNPFSQDPYNAVGAFGVQLALFTAILCLIRVLVPRPTKDISASQKLFIIRGCTVSVQSVAVTLAAYVVAMIRYHSLWIFSPNGQLLALLMAIMTFLAAVAAWRIDLLSYNAGMSSDSRARKMALMNCLAGVLILGIFPPGWQRGVFGGLLAAVLGAALLLLLTWSLAAALSPRIDVQMEDFLGDLTDLVSWLKDKSHFFAGILKGIEKLFRALVMNSLVQQLNPRRHTVRFAVVVSIVVGIVVAIFKGMSQNLFAEPGGVLLVIVIFSLVEAVGVLIGHFLFTRYLGIFRME